MLFPEGTTTLLQRNPDGKTSTELSLQLPREWEMCVMPKTLPEMPQGDAPKTEKCVSQEICLIGGTEMLPYVRTTAHDAEYFHSGHCQCKIHLTLFYTLKTFN